MVMERTDTDFFELLQLLANPKLFEKRCIRANTAHLYTQSKFNLLREESEGFSKLLTVLSENLPPKLETFWTTSSPR
ncbi:MAG: hypothetical protein RL354_378, partial [Planctomycetota bacterium]